MAVSESFPIISADPFSLEILTKQATGEGSHCKIETHLKKWKETYDNWRIWPTKALPYAGSKPGYELI